MIPDDQVEEVRQRADIVDVVGEYVQLKKKGRDYWACCPFHEENTPSFHVVPDKGFYKCFGCGESGDVFSFLMKRAGMDFVDAVKHVAARAGVEIREVRRDQRDDDPLRPLHEANAFARDFFRGALLDERRGARVRAYLETRGIIEETSEAFGLGYAPIEPPTLRDAAATHGIGDDLLEGVGLVRTAEGGESIETFRDRLIFPIEEVGGRVVAFGGRLLPDSGRRGPKYINSPETPVYTKGEVLYGLARARHAVRREGAAILVEGYMDVVALSAAGFETVVAGLGTALTERQVELLARYARKVLLLFDADEAGLRATFRAADLLLEAGLHPQVVTLPDGEDPDTVIRRGGARALRTYLDEAVDVLDRKLQLLEEKDWFSSIERTRSAIDRLLPTLRAVSDPTLRDLYVSKVAGRTGLKRETLEDEIERSGTGMRRRGAVRPDSGGGARQGDDPNRYGRGRGSFGIDRGAGRSRGAPLLARLGPERLLVRLLLHTRHWIDRAAERVAPEDFSDPSYRAIFRALVTDPELETAPAELDAQARLRFEELMADPEELSHAGRVFEEAVNRIRGSALEREIRKLDAQIGEAADEDERLRLAAEKERLRRERRAFGEDWSPSVRRSASPGNADNHRTRD